MSQELRRYDLRCPKCHRVVFKKKKTKCQDCKIIKEMIELFATELKGDFWAPTFLWRQNGSMAASISIVKEVWVNVGRFPEIPRDKIQFPVFHVYNSIDPSKAYSPDSGYGVNSYNQPFLSLDEALAVVEQQEKEALASGRWVHLKDLDKKK